MKEYVSSRRLSVFAWGTGLSVTWIACSILVLPDGWPWVGLGWAGLAFAGALWQLGRTGSRSIAQVLHDQDAQPVPALATRSLKAR